MDCDTYEEVEEKILGIVIRLDVESVDKERYTHFLLYLLRVFLQVWEVEGQHK